MAASTNTLPGRQATFRDARPAFIWCATGILLLASLLRLAWLREVPPGLSQDEVLNADIVSFILQGKHTFFFREGYGHEPLYHYLATPFQPLLGDNLLSIRLPASFLGLLLIALVMRWAGREFDRRVALLTGLLLAVGWWAIIFSRVGLRPILEPVLLVTAVYFWPYPRRAQSRRILLSGFFLGLSMYSYTAASAMLLMPLIYALYLLVCRARASGRPAESSQAIDRRALLAGPAVLVIALLIMLPMLLTLWADPSLLQRVDQLSGPLDALREGSIVPLAETTLATLGVFGITGDPRFTYMMPHTPLFGPVTALLFVAGLMVALKHARHNAPHGLVLIWLLAGLLPSAVTPQAPSAIRLVGALPVLFLLPALAIDWAWSRLSALSPARRARAFAVGAVLLTLLLVGNVGRTIRDGFIRWPAELETRMRYQTVLRDIGYYLEQNAPATPVVAEAFFEPIDHDSLRRNLGRSIRVRWVQGQHALVFPAEQSGSLLVPEFAAPDPALLEASGIAPEPVFRSSGVPSFAVYDLPAPPVLLVLDEPITFGEAVTLLGYRILPVRSNGDLPLLTLWQVEDTLPADLAIFAHLVSPDGAIIAQHDALDAAPATLQQGDLVLQLHLIPLGDGTPPPDAGLTLGLYTRGDGVRLTHPGTPPDRLFLAVPDFEVE